MMGCLECASASFGGCWPSKSAEHAALAVVMHGLSTACMTLYVQGNIKPSTLGKCLAKRQRTENASTIRLHKQGKVALGLSNF